MVYKDFVTLPNKGLNFSIKSHGCRDSNVNRGNLTFFFKLNLQRTTEFCKQNKGKKEKKKSGSYWYHGTESEEAN